MLPQYNNWLMLVVAKPPRRDVHNVVLCPVRSSYSANLEVVMTSGGSSLRCLGGP